MKFVMNSIYCYVSILIIIASSHIGTTRRGRSHLHLDWSHLHLFIDLWIYFGKKNFLWSEIKIFKKIYDKKIMNEHFRFFIFSLLPS